MHLFVQKFFKLLRDDKTPVLSPLWVKKSNARNEALDEMVYAYAAFCRFKQRYDRRTIWDQLEKKRNPTEPKQEVPLRSGRQKAAKKRSFVANW